MPRCDYDQIKNKYAQYVESFITRNTELYNELMVEDVECKISISHNLDNDESGLQNVKNFTLNYPKTDEMRCSIYNYTCRIKNNESQQVGYIIIVSDNYKDNEEMDAFYYSITTAAHWVKEDDEWKMNELHMDVYPFLDAGLRSYFERTWVFSNPLATYEDNLKLPAICGEYDSPWIRIPDAEDIYTDEEKVKDCYNKCFFGADYAVFEHRVDSISRYSGTNSLKFGKDEGRRNFRALRLKRQKDRYWVHPFKHESITFNEDKSVATDKTYRVFGWKQRIREYKWTKDNINIEHMCSDSRGYTEFILEDEEYRSSFMYECVAGTGIYEFNEYGNNLYGDEA